MARPIIDVLSPYTDSREDIVFKISNPINLGSLQKFIDTPIIYNEDIS